MTCGDRVSAVGFSDGIYSVAAYGRNKAYERANNSLRNWIPFVREYAFANATEGPVGSTRS